MKPAKPVWLPSERAGPAWAAAAAHAARPSAKNCGAVRLAEHSVVLRTPPLLGEKMTATGWCCRPGPLDFGVFG